ncbi:MAG: M28 family peptidase, partial [Alphaproteobacteria bacterium]
MKTHKTNLILLLFLFISTVVFAQNATSIKYGEQITQDVLRKHISVLASDSLEGRDTGTPGMRKAAAYVTDVFTSTGVQPALSGSYLQQMPFIRQTASSITISSESKPFIFGDDFIVTDLPSQLDLKISEIIFAGYGIMDSSSGWNDYLNVDVKGKTIIIFDDEPFGKKGKSPITKTKEPSAWSKSDEQKIKIAYDKGANAVLLVNNDMKGLQRVAKRWMTSGRLKLVENKDETFMPVIHISDNMADELLKTTGSSAGELKGIIGRTGKPKPFVINQQLNIQITSEKVFCTNIIGVVEGSDKKEEVIVVSAHIDHLGKRDGKIYYGADDDASGCAAVMAMGEQFAKAKKEGNGPRRT